jgi:hypothetical protein
MICSSVCICGRGVAVGAGWALYDPAPGSVNTSRAGGRTWAGFSAPVIGCTVGAPGADGAAVGGRMTGCEVVVTLVVDGAGVAAPAGAVVFRGSIGR